MGILDFLRRKRDKRLRWFQNNEGNNRDTIRCPKCNRKLGNRRELRARVAGMFSPGASVGGSTKCPHCGAEIYISL